MKTVSARDPCVGKTWATRAPGSRLFQEYVNGSLSYSAFASQWQSLLTSAAQQWATQNHVDLNKY